MFYVLGKEKFSLNYQITNCFFIPGGDFYAHFEIINNSSEPISITGISINKIYAVQMKE